LFQTRGVRLSWPPVLLFLFFRFHLPIPRCFLNEPHYTRFRFNTFCIVFLFIIFFFIFIWFFLTFWACFSPTLYLYGMMRWFGFNISSTVRLGYSVDRAASIFLRSELTVRGLFFPLFSVGAACLHVAHNVVFRLFPARKTSKWSAGVLLLFFFDQ